MRRRRTAAAKKVLSPTSESTVMASDLVSPCRNQQLTKKNINSTAQHTTAWKGRGGERARADPEERRRHGGSGRGGEAPIPISGGRRGARGRGQGRQY